MKLAAMTQLTVTEYLCHKWPLICSACRNDNAPFLIYDFVTRAARRLPPVEQELLVLLEHLSPPSPDFFVGFVLLNLYFSV